MYSFRKSKKGFTLVELMVVVAIIAILALLGLRLFLMQQIRAKNAIVKANAATVHTIIQGNLADFSYATADLAVNDIRKADGITALAGGTGDNTDRPAGMKNPHLTGTTNLVVATVGSGTGYATELLFIGAATGLLNTTYGGAAIVGEDSTTPNKFFILAIDNLSGKLGEVYVAQK
jgi:type IV pilus assembly protein PilA